VNGPVGALAGLGAVGCAQALLAALGGGLVADCACGVRHCRIRDGKGKLAGMLKQRFILLGDVTIRLPVVIV